jgi:uncharacterized protein YcfL
MKRIILLLIIISSILMVACESEQPADTSDIGIIVDDVPKDVGDTSMPQQDNDEIMDKYADTTNIDVAIDEIKQVE